MKNKIKLKFNPGITTGIIIAALFTAMCMRFPDICLRALAKAAVFSARTVLPYEIIKPREITENGDRVEDTADVSLYEKETTENATKQDTEKPSENDSSSDFQTSAPQTSDFTSTPQDIQELIKKYSSLSSKDKKDGSISETTYKKAGVTDSYGKVRVKNVNDTGIDIKGLLKEKADLKITDKSEPAVLIFHTHTTERYQILDRDFYPQGYTSRSENPSENMVRVGNEIAGELEKAGYKVIHDTKIYDKQYNGAYSRSRVSVEEYLKKYPSLQVVLDIHRDAIELNDGTKLKPVCTVQNKKCAQIMIISGCQEKGNGISRFEDWRYNLVFAVQLQNKLESLFEGITRPLYFCPRKYNMDTSHCSLLIEVGSDANTLEEAVYAGRCLGRALSELMNEYK